MTSTTVEPFDFDDWKELAISDPQAFEARRHEVIERQINRASLPLQRRLRGLQWQIDIIRRRYKDPKVSSAKLFDMMWQQVYGEGGFLQALTMRREPAALPPAIENNVIVMQQYLQERSG